MIPNSTDYLFYGGNSMEKCDCGAMVDICYWNPYTQTKTCFVCSEKKRKEQQEVKNEI